MLVVTRADVEERCLARSRRSPGRRGFFEDLEALLERVVPSSHSGREKLLAFLLGPRSDQVPVAGGALCLGQWQRILLFWLDAQHRPEWTLTLLG